MIAFNFESALCDEVDARPLHNEDIIVVKDLYEYARGNVPNHVARVISKMEREDPYVALYIQEVRAALKLEENSEQL